MNVGELKKQLEDVPDSWDVKVENSDPSDTLVVFEPGLVTIFSSPIASSLAQLRKNTAALKRATASLKSD